MTQYTVMGAGAWGTALAIVLAEKRHDVWLWSRRAEHAEALLGDRENKRYLPGFPLPPNVIPTNDLDRALPGSEMVVVVVPSHGFRESLALMKPHLPPSAALVNAAKGIENDTLMLMGEVAEDVLGHAVRDRYTVLSGPSFAQEVAARLPTNVVVASASEELSKDVQHRFATERLRVYSSDDPAGVEVAGALKNVIAIAAGACDGLGFGHNTRAALITRGLAEIARIALAKGGNVLTLAGLAGMGDLVLTCTASLSRNRTVGYEMGLGRSLDDVLGGLGHVAEGVRTAKSAHDLALALNVELPICNEVYSVLYERKSPLQAVEDVLTRPLKKEWS